MTQLAPTRVTTADLDWWLDLAPRLDWIFAKTYADTAPHSYVVRGRTKAMTDADYGRAGRVIRTFGQPAKFYDTTNIYLTSPDGSLKWWTMDAAAANTTLINQATTDRVYGEQNAPSTYSGIWSVYDEIATDYDRLWSPVDGDEKVGLLRLIESLGLDSPMTLDIGCGTGALLDLGITTPDRYVGLDPSQAMLNEMVRKYSKVAGVIPSRADDALQSLESTHFDVVAALFGSASYVSPGSLERVVRHSRGVVVLMFYGTSFLPGYASQIDPLIEKSNAIEPSHRPGVRPRFLGKYEVRVVDVR